MNIDRNQVINWLNTASPADIVALAQPYLSKAGNLPTNEREQFTREVGNDPSITKLFRQTA